MRFLIRGLGFALLTGVIAAVAALVVAGWMSPRYAADARLLVATPGQNLRDVAGMPFTISPLDSATYQELAKTDTILLEALRRLGSDLPKLSDAEELMLRMKVTTSEGRSSSVVGVNVWAGDPETASAEANAVALSMLAWEQQRASDTVAQAISALSARVDALSAEIAELASADGANELAIAEVVSLRDSQRNLLLSMRGTVGDTFASLSVFQLALGPAPQVAPRPALYAALAFIAGLVCAYALLIVMRAASGRVRTLEELARLVEAPVLAAIPQGALRRRCSRDEYRLTYLAAKLALLSNATQNQFLVVGLSDGLDTRELSFGLARAFAGTGHQTLFVSSDLRRPMTKLAFVDAEIDLPGPGLEQFMTAPFDRYHPNEFTVGEDTFAMVAPRESGVSPLKVLAGGFAAFLEHVKPLYDTIVIDTASAVTMPDALTLASEIPKLIVVVRFTGLNREVLRAVLNGLSPVRQDIVGVIAVDVPSELCRNIN